MILNKSLEVADENLPGTYFWSEAIEVCSKLGDGWRLPTKEELDLLYRHKDEIGGLGEGWLWSSSQSINSYAWLQRFSDGIQLGNFKLDGHGVRAVRALKDNQLMLEL